MNHCGDCALCCRLLAVTELDKPRDSWCRHCRPAAAAPCTIYGTRPQPCRQFECLWLEHRQTPGLEALPTALRPNRCHVMFTGDGAGGLLAHVDPDHPDAWKRPLPAGIIARARQAGDPVTIRCGERSWRLT
ncbi:MAG TPA: hypothetical protein VGM09_25220 [Bradyrhizobium sp.]|jgi:hypothetical protein